VSRYGLAVYGAPTVYGDTSSAAYDARPIFAYSFPKSYRDAGDGSVVPYLPSQYSPLAVDPDLDEDYPDMFWGPSYFSQYLTDFYEDSYRQIFIEPELGSNFYYVLLTWTPPGGRWTDLAVVRRRYGPPETVDDGITVLTVPSTTLRTEYVETLPQGENVYYGIFVRTSFGEWKMAGYTEALNCRNHDGLEEFFRAIPRVYTSASGGMLDVIDRRGHLSRFLQGLAFEYDYWKTQADRLSHDPGRMPWSSVALWSKQLGMSDLDIVTVGDRNLRRWLTSASTYSETKGTKNGIEAMATAITGWPITASVSPNLMLDSDDSSAEAGGTLVEQPSRWVPSGGVLGRAVIGASVTSPVGVGSAITPVQGQTPPLQGYVFTFAPGGATASLSLGNDNPVNHGIPLPTLTVTDKSLTSNVATLTTSVAHGLTVGNVVSVSGVDATFDGTYTLSAVTSTTLSYAKTAANVTLAKSGGSIKPLSYQFNICFRSTVTVTGSLKADITWYDIRGASISTTAGTNLAATGSWQQTTTTTGTAPAGAAYAGITLAFSSITGSPVYHLDMAQFVSSTTDIAGKFYDARSVDLNVAPLRTNYCINPSFETDVVSWSAGSTATGLGYVGVSAGTPNALSLNNTQIASGTATSTAVGTFAANDPVTASVHVKATSGSGATSVTIPLKLECKNSGGTTISTDTTSATVTPGSYQRISVTRLKAPANTSYVTLTVAGTGTSANMTGAGSSLLVDGCLIEKRETLLSYFDAGVYNDTGTAKWAGTAHASISYLYPFRLSRQASLARIMADYLPEPVYARVVLQ